MHAIPFRLKRAFQSSLKMMHPIAALHDLTPARFDLLYALRAMRRYARDQTQLAKTLGVSRATVCKMVGSLEKAGLVVRRISDFDHRFRDVELTRYGRRCFSRLLKLLPLVDENYYRAMYHWEASRALRRNFFHRMRWRVAHLARALGDEAILYD